MFYQNRLLILFIIVCFILPCYAAENSHESPAPLEPEIRTTVFERGEVGYHSFRIPALLSTPRGTLLAFAEGRKHNLKDSGDIDLVLKRSEDQGKTWSDLAVIWNDAENTCGNPCPVVDQTTGRIWLPLTWNHGKDHANQIRDQSGHDTRRVFMSYSDDDGLTWKRPYEVTESTKKPEWTWYATGPGNGIQLTRGKYKGRLVIPCDHNVTLQGSVIRRAHAIFSDDHGKSWKVSEPIGEKTNECAVVELADGRLLMNMRSYHGKNRRAIAFSEDGGATWSDVTLDQALIEPVCQASLIRARFPAAEKPGQILFSNPASQKREKMVVRLSEDDGRTWKTSRLVTAGSAAYSSLVEIGSGEIGLLYERDGYRTIEYVAFQLAAFQPGP
ncbi:sialidase family protein [Gimesia sp.]|uniref:sialidase family protein n=1 Tax=Gimesia sp. TaxID=2024833 RepID=UPI000C38E1E0|nr:sialidase family protein [Gimesia sp.]MAX37158.1 glycosyl hydrolase [Gimesia sp.]HAH44488.1 exo-alpha-sialidase [Planctomycetaceae bacterium]HBL46541.1 exo-alpha-sialidase [Planctomycetaceae bacterium]|tara:strand:- start:12483 stop:13640 length:1158 start_codon:yes stop_codon:yes gene_type:complete